MTKMRHSLPRRASRFAPTIQPRARWQRGDAVVAPTHSPGAAALIPARTRRAGLRQMLARFERRALLPIALACLVFGLLFGITGAFGDSVVASHAGKSAMIFGFAGLRRMAGFGPEAVDAST